MQKAAISHSPLLLLITLASDEIIVSLTSETQLYGQISVAPCDANERTLPAIAMLLETAKVSVQQLSAIACSRGPGAFITLRAIVVTANGLSFATEVPLIGLQKAEIAVKHLHSASYDATCYLQRAHRGEVTICWYQPPHEPVLATISTTSLKAWIEERAHDIRIQWAGPELAACRALLEPWQIPTEQPFTEVPFELLRDAAVTAWRSGAFSAQLIPIYNRSATFGRI